MGLGLGRGKAPAARRSSLLWTGSTALAILVALPIQWQRYYVPLQPETSLLEALGLVALGKFAAALSKRRVEMGATTSVAGEGDRPGRGGLDFPA